jgi:spore germination protein GerM
VFYQSDIQLESATVENGLATINLSGDLELGGACDNPRVEAQIEQTALQFPTVDEVDIFLNGQPLEEVLAGSA